MKLIIGLGNPGLKYRNTRHNVGFLLLDMLIDNEKWETSKKGQAKHSKREIAGEKVELIKPQTFMNNSGQAANYAIRKHDLEVGDIIVIHDDIDLPLGKIRISQGSSSAGNRGVQSIIDHLSSKDFVRLRFGVAPEERPRNFNAAKYVLKKFSKKEQAVLDDIFDKSREALETIIKDGPKKAMNDFNS